MASPMRKENNPRSISMTIRGKCRCSASPYIAAGRMITVDMVLPEIRQYLIISNNK